MKPMMRSCSPVAASVLIFLLCLFTATGFCAEEGKVTMEQWLRIINPGDTNKPSPPTPATKATGNSEGGAGEGSTNVTGAKGATVKDSVAVARDNLNWSRPALLSRMAPDSNVPAKRRPVNTLSAAERRKEENRCVRNVIVLVHGHNEAEKDGLINAPDVGSPWFYGYKRDVWTNLYDTFMTKYDARASCTAFYEYIYPSYKSAFDDLGPELASKLKSELKSLLLPKDADLNLLMVAHSMGGLVARSAIQGFDADLHQAFQSLVTWGSPHRGSALTSLQYVLNSDVVYHYVGDNLTLAMAGRYATNAMQIDTPGNRDLKWDNARPLALDEWFTSSQYHTGSMAEYRLDKGTRLYNERLRAFNNNDLYGSGSGSNLKNKSGFLKYNFAYGITTNTATADRTFVATGATLARKLIKNPTQTFEGVNINEGDGAVTITSMAAEGLQGYRMNFGDFNHEEYYGAPGAPAGYDGPSTFTQPNKAKAAAELTFAWLMQEMDQEKGLFKCDPFIAAISPPQGVTGSQATIKGRCFNNSDNKLAVSFNSANAQTIQVKTCNEIIVTVPEGATTGHVVVTANGVASNGMPFRVIKDDSSPAAAVKKDASPGSCTVNIAKQCNDCPAGQKLGLIHNGYADPAACDTACFSTAYTFSGTQALMSTDGDQSHFEGWICSGPGYELVGGTCWLTCSSGGSFSVTAKYKYWSR